MKLNDAIYDTWNIWRVPKIKVKKERERNTLIHEDVRLNETRCAELQGSKQQYDTERSRSSNNTLSNHYS